MSTPLLDQAPPLSLLPPPPPPPPIEVTQQAYTTHSGNGSVGAVIGVVAVITVLGVVAGVIGRICSGRRVMGFGDYDIETWVETKCSSCVDGTIVIRSHRPPPPVPPPQVVVPPETNAGGEGVAPELEEAPREIKEADLDHDHEDEEDDGDDDDEDEDIEEEEEGDEEEEQKQSSHSQHGHDTDVVNGNEMDSAVDLVMLEHSKYEKEAVRSGLIQDVLDEWRFFDFNQSVVSDDSVVKDQSTKLMEINRHGDQEKEGETMFPDEIWNEWNFGKNKYLAFFNSKLDNKSDKSESKSSDRTGVMEESGSLAANEFVCPSGVGIFEAVNEGFHDKQPNSKGKEEGANPMEMVSESHMGVQRSIPVVENGPVVSDEEEDIMSILKEMNETRALKRKEAKKKEKTRKSRPKKLKL
ncbi:hypothetical protein PIB30_028159 [Stylosanthes scabra]|uniref:Uncharacterized protein n=1 Tax=Stylosanthes scabra TaxID=79078 RepID=A0ABU6YB49_9FABA|nr:hypothetical protein [Stylosanthes scabra]